MTNPITSALGYTVPTRDGYRTVITICAGRAVLRGTASNLARGEGEGFYRVGNAGQYGPCIAAPYAKTADEALRILASSLIGPKPAKGAVAALAANLPTKATVKFDFVAV